jgi:hypothetical protein
MCFCSEMRVKKNHSCVDDQGLIFTAYLTAWNGRTSNLTDLISDLSNRFSGEPPLFKYKHNPADPVLNRPPSNPHPLAPRPASGSVGNRPPSP